MLGCVAAGIAIEGVGDVSLLSTYAFALKFSGFFLYLSKKIVLLGIKFRYHNFAKF